MRKWVQNFGGAEIEFDIIYDTTYHGVQPAQSILDLSWKHLLSGHFSLFQQNWVILDHLLKSPLILQVFQIKIRPSVAQYDHW